MAQRIGIFGGSFNPVHLGHLIMAECSREQAQLDKILFIPAATPPHKQHEHLASCEARLEMLRLAIGGHDQFSVCDIECTRGGISYTIDTLIALRQQSAQDEFWLMLGPDALADLPTWREPARLLTMVGILALERRGTDDLDTVLSEPALANLLTAEQRQQIVADRVRVPTIAIRASQLRSAVAAGQSIRFRTPRAVERLIKSRGLYRD
jgi:nicotinate-nucleotide adenylyltransferase